jgi:hypothetical protein
MLTPMSGGVPIRQALGRERVHMVAATELGGPMGVAEEQARRQAEALAISMGITFYAVRNPEGDLLGRRRQLTTNSSRRSTRPASPIISWSRGYRGEP